MTEKSVVFQPLDGHPRGAFSCKHRSIQHFFRKWAEDNHAKYKQRIFVACEEGRDKPLGFYGLTLMTFESSMDEEAGAKYAERRVPTIYLAALARDKNLSDSGFGALLINDALKRCLEVRRNVGVYALSLHAANEEVAKIYEGYGFIRFENGETQPDADGVEMPAMFFRLADAEAAFAELEA